MVGIRPEKETDYALLDALHSQAFGAEGEANLVRNLRQGAFFTPSLSVVAEEDGRIIGHALFSDIVLTGSAGPVKTAALAPVAVLPEKQNQGVGTRLIETGLKAAAKAGYQCVLVLGEPGYYSRFGFDVNLAGKIQSPYAGPYFMALEIKSGILETQRDLTAIYSHPFSLLEDAA